MKAYRILALNSMFGFPQKASAFILSDQSGHNSKPLPGYADNKPEHRFEHLTHLQVYKFLTGPGLKPLIARSAETFSRNMLDLDISYEWQERSDLCTWLKELMLRTAVESIFGPNLLALNPNLIQDILEYDSNLSLFGKPIPRWLIPKAYRARDRCIASFKKYHIFLKQHPKKIIPTGDDAHYDSFCGPEFIRLRLEAWSKMDAMTADAQASEDFQFLWSANHNASIAAFWLLCYILRSPTILVRFCTAIKTLPSKPPQTLDPALLVTSPYLSSLYAETLRITSGDTILRGPNLCDIQLEKWRIPANGMISIPVWLMHNDENAWNTGTAEDPHPMREFWDQRFLVHAASGLTGPAKSNTTPSDITARSKAEVPGKEERSSDPEFSIKGLNGVFIPYGGGPRMCPGRMFVKHAILYNVARVLEEYDIKILGPAPEICFKDFGTGILGPKVKPPFKIRRRREGRFKKEGGI